MIPLLLPLLFYSIISTPPVVELRPRYAIHQTSDNKLVRRSLPQIPFLFPSHSSNKDSFKVKQVLGEYPTPSLRDELTSLPIAYTTKPILTPDMTDMETLINLAYMTANSYLMPNHTNWYNLTNWHMHKPFGWDVQGLRGYVYADTNETTFIISVKGTTAQFLWGGGGPTAETDKKQDNLLFSCCCARVDFTWSTVCDCHQSGNMCGQDCLENSVNLNSSYYNIAQDEFNKIYQNYPNASIWYLGHSLGGAISTLMGLTYGIPAVAFEAPGDMLPARRLHLPLPPGINFTDLPIFHVGHNADPIFLGECQGVSSSCYLAGYAMETYSPSLMCIVMLIYIVGNVILDVGVFLMPRPSWAGAWIFVTIALTTLLTSYWLVGMNRFLFVSLSQVIVLSVISGISQSQYDFIFCELCW